MRASGLLNSPLPKCMRCIGQCGRQIRIMTERAVLQAGARAETEKSWNNIMRPETISADRLSEKSWKKQ